MESTHSSNISTAHDALELKSYQEIIIDSETGEEVVADKYLYLPGRPREYRFNGQNGQFNLYGERVLMDERGKTLSSFTFQPIAYRFFEDVLFGRTEKEMWAELFFIDSQQCVSSIMFNNTSVSELFRLMEPLHYEKLSLCDVTLTARPERVTSKGDPTKTWYITRFSYEVSQAEKVKEYREYIRDHAVYRAETLTPVAEHKVVSRSFARLLESEEIMPLGAVAQSQAA
jgi:hypothetical protein